MKDKKKTKRNKWIKVGGSGIHQTGMFAKRNIPEGERLIEYVGEKITKKESYRRRDEQDEKGRGKGDGTVYIFTLNKRHDIDGAVPENVARFINHSCDPNAVVDIKKGRIWIYSLRDIAKGEEITYDYNFDADHYEDNPCLCGTPKCLGYIVGEECRKKLKRLLKKKKEAKKKKRKKKDKK